MKILLSGFLLTLAISHADTKHVYFGTSGREAKGIYQAKFDSEKGALSVPTLAAEVKSPGFLAMHPNGDALYAVANTPDGAGVVAYTVDDAGALTLLNTAPIGDGGGAHVAVHPSGKLLLTAQYGGGSTACFKLAVDGKLAGLPVLHEHEGGSKVVGKRQDSPHPHWCGFSPDGKFAFVPDLGMDGIVIYKVDAKNSSISKHGFAASIPGGGPRHMRFSVDGKFIYLLNELALAVSTFAYDADKGTATLLTTTQSLSDAVKAKETFNSASEILVHPNGKFVYSANRGNDSVTAYVANPKTGELAVTEVEPIRGAWPRNINIDATGKWLLAAGAQSNTISMFEINQESGELTFHRGKIVNVPGSICILFGY
ncbi:lactonase family protein [Verrucomicrobiales bacterium]|jgi:6-phosphogluconolactonase|nr:lactonase family protein [Verrucomicrobiales bacterium]MDC0503826.1 lactonase family protein [Verrucomicrobiales bacterium]MDF1785017.1 lactonase family protein [Verrucomicrobiales bacterium]